MFLGRVQIKTQLKSCTKTRLRQPWTDPRDYHSDYLIIDSDYSIIPFDYLKTKQISTCSENVISALGNRFCNLKRTFHHSQYSYIDIQYLNIQNK